MLYNVFTMSDRKFSSIDALSNRSVQLVSALQVLVCTVDGPLIKN